MRARVRAFGIEHGDRAGFQRCINGKDAHLQTGCHHPRKRMIQ
jgi:hypothetical protein